MVIHLFHSPSNDHSAHYIHVEDILGQPVRTLHGWEGSMLNAFIYRTVVLKFPKQVTFRRKQNFNSEKYISILIYEV